jgi:hypothetical protein
MASQLPCVSARAVDLMALWQSLQSEMQLWHHINNVFICQYVG